MSSFSQSFWGTVVNQAGAGPAPLPYDSLTSQKLAQAITFCLFPATQEAAAALAHKIATEDGVARAINSFHRNLPQRRQRCDFFPHETAVWSYGRGSREIQMCGGVVTILRRHGVDLKGLEL